MNYRVDLDCLVQGHGTDLVAKVMGVGLHSLKAIRSGHRRINGDQLWRLGYFPEHDPEKTIVALGTKRMRLGKVEEIYPADSM